MNFKVERNDITNMAVDAIVLPANKRLTEGSGVSAVIFGKAGRKQLKKECALQGKLEVGNAVVTNAYKLPSKYIIHAVVPKWKGGRRNEYEKLCRAYLSALCLADQQQCTSLAIPLLSSGNNGFDLDVAIEVAAVSIWTYKPTYTLRDVTLVVFDPRSTFRMIQLGFEVDEKIDQDYVDAQDDSYKPLVVHQMNDGLQAAGKLAAEGVQAAGESLQAAGKTAGESMKAAGAVAGETLVAASNYINNDPILQQTISVAAVQVAALALNGGKPSKSMIVGLLQNTAGKLLGSRS